MWIGMQTRSIRRLCVSKKHTAEATPLNMKNMYGTPIRVGARVRARTSGVMIGSSRPPLSIAQVPTALWKNWTIWAEPNTSTMPKITDMAMPQVSRPTKAKKPQAPQLARFQQGMFGKLRDRFFNF